MVPLYPHQQGRRVAVLLVLTMSSQLISRLISSARRLNLVYLAYKPNVNGGYRVSNVRARQLSSKSGDEYYTSAGLHGAKYPETEMNEVLKRVSKIEGPEIERRRWFNIVRNFALVIVIFFTPWLIALRVLINFSQWGCGFDPPLD